MATPITLISILLLAAAAAPSANAAVCNTQGLKVKLEHCIDLPQLGAFFHYKYNATNESISFAFIAKPSQPDGWIAWGINPTAPAMVGTQAIVAFKDKGVVVPTTYNLKSKKATDVVAGSISLATWDLTAETFGKAGEFIIYGNTKLPSMTVPDTINHVWNVGPSVDGKVLARHEEKEENLEAKSTLKLVSGVSSSSSSPSGTSSPPAPAPKSSALRSYGSWETTMLFGVVALCSFIFF